MLFLKIIFELLNSRVVLCDTWNSGTPTHCVKLSPNLLVILNVLIKQSFQIRIGELRCDPSIHLSPIWAIGLSWSGDHHLFANDRLILWPVLVCYESAGRCHCTTIIMAGDHMLNQPTFMVNARLYFLHGVGVVVVWWVELRSIRWHRNHQFIPSTN